MRSPQKRWGREGHNYKENSIFYTDIQKYGWDDGFIHEILYENISKEEAEQIEFDLVNLYNSANIDYGYNRNNGGHGIGKMSEQTKKKISQSNTGKKRTPEQKKHMSDIALKMSDEHKKKISEAHMGAEPWNKGKIYTEEQKDKVKGNTYCAVLCVETGIVYKSMSYVQRQLNIYASNINKACKNPKRTAGGFHWRYADE